MQNTPLNILKEPTVLRAKAIRGKREHNGHSAVDLERLGGACVVGASVVGGPVHRGNDDGEVGQARWGGNGVEHQVDAVARCNLTVPRGICRGPAKVPVLQVQLMDVRRAQVEHGDFNAGLCRAA